VRFGIPQGVASAILLPAVIRFNLPACLDKYVQVARIFGEPVAGLSPRRAAERAAVAVEELRRDIGVAAKLGGFGVAEKHVDELVEDAAKSGTAAGGPHRATAADMAAILKAELA
jgi:alcohol dehydrogenase class IV